MRTSCYPVIATHGFTVVLSVFGGTPPAKPLKYKSRFFISDLESGIARAHCTGFEFSRPSAIFVFARLKLWSEDITWMSNDNYPCSICVVVTGVPSHCLALQETKNPAYDLQAGVFGKCFCFSLLPACAGLYRQDGRQID